MAFWVTFFWRRGALLLAPWASLLGAGDAAQIPVRDVLLSLFLFPSRFCSSMGHWRSSFALNCPRGLPSTGQVAALLTEKEKR